jgi:predicted NUDIX family NTP pyrophosphohydrolase
MKKKSAGILVYKIINETPEFLLVHPGGPFWKNKDAGVWSVPKGEYENEDPFDCAIREFREETGISITGDFIPLKPVKQKGGKVITVFAIEKNLDISVFHSNTFDLEWPPHSGKYQKFPEVDKVDWFDKEKAREKINPAQFALIEELISLLDEKQKS